MMVIFNQTFVGVWCISTASFMALVAAWTSGHTHGNQLISLFDLREYLAWGMEGFDSTNPHLPHRASIRRQAHKQTFRCSSTVKGHPLTSRAPVTSVNHIRSDKKKRHLIWKPRRYYTLSIPLLTFQLFVCLFFYVLKFMIITLYYIVTRGSSLY